MKSKIKTYKEDLLRTLKLVLKKNISTNQPTLERYKTLIIQSFNIYTKNLTLLNVLAKPEESILISKAFNFGKEKTVQAFSNLHINLLIDLQLGQQILPSNLTVIDQTESDDEDLNHSEFFPDDLVEDNIFDISTLYSEMALPTPDFLRLCANTINYVYSGEPTGLKSFVNAINLLNGLATTDELREILINFIKTKLSGKAADAVPDSVNTIANIRASLQEKIKPDSSKVLEGRLAAIKMDRQSLQDFSKLAEDLADQLNRSLVMEGIPSEKAMEITIDHTVKMCRNSAKTDLVKSVLAATKFESPKEVISKLIVETNVQTEERQILAFRAQNRRGQGQQRPMNNNNRQINRYRNNGQANGQGRNNYRQSNNHNNNFNNQRNNRPNNFGQQQQRRQYSNNQQQGQRTFYNTNHSNATGNVRMASGNGQAPTQEQRESVAQHFEM